MAERVPITEEQLDALRAEAGQKGRAQQFEVVPICGPIAAGTAVSYHGNPVLKPPTWTWQVPLYFFVGGIAGMSSVIALATRVFDNPGVTRAALWLALIAGVISAPLLIADLGRPARFLNMLRVFKPRSAMSLGAWTLSAFSSAAALAVICHEFNLAGYGNSFSTVLEWLAQILAASSGVVLASYTSVLLSVTAIPVWSENRKLLSAIFLTGALGSSAAVVELLGFTIPATQFIGILTSIVEIVIAIVIEARGRYVDRPLRVGTVAWFIRTGAVMSGPIPLVMRIAWSDTLELRYIAAVCFAIGALITRYAWIAAGGTSSRDPQALFQIQRRAKSTVD